MSTTSPWVVETARRAASGQCVRVRLPLHDQVLDRGRLVRRTVALDHTLRMLGYAHVIFFDALTGAHARRAAPAELAPVLREVLGHDHDVDARRQTFDGDPELDSLRAATDVLAARGRGPANEDVSPDAVLAHAQELVARSPLPIAVVIDDAELLFPRAGHDDARTIAARLRAAIDLRRRFPDGAPRSTVVLLQTGPGAHSLDDFRHAGLHQIEACSPDISERRAGWQSTVAELPEGRRPNGTFVDRLAQISDIPLGQMATAFRDAEILGLEDPDAPWLLRSFNRGPQTAAWESVDPHRFADELRRAAQSALVGQDHVIDRVIDRFIRSMQGVRRSGATREPLAVFVFTGPPGTGKTVLARTIARVGLGDESRLVRFDMNDFQDEASIRRLIGSERGYVDSEKGGELVNAVLANPSCVILLDEFDKAPPAVAKVLLQLLEEGRISDGQGRVADAGDAVIILASNHGIADAPLHAPVQDVITHYEEALVRHFENGGSGADIGIGRPFVSRLKLTATTVGFAPLRAGEVGGIARLACDETVRAYAAMGTEVIVDRDAVARQVEARMAGTEELEKYGARSAIPFVDQLVNAPVAFCRADHFGAPSLRVVVTVHPDGTSTAAAVPDGTAAAT